jgi:23S rRNA (uracil1939-C5)-methyltransferase
LIPGALGLARLDTRTVLVPFAAPGDRIRISANPGKYQGALRAPILELLEPGPDRIQPVCPHYGICGGCHVQHLRPDYVRDLKRDFVVDALRRMAHLADAGNCVSPLPATTRNTGYRCRATLHVEHTSGRPRIGFHRATSHRVVDLDDCPILDPRLADMLVPLHGILDAMSDARHVAAIEMACGDPDISAVDLVLILTGSLGTADRKLLVRRAMEPDINRLWLQQTGGPHTTPAGSGRAPLVPGPPLRYTVDRYPLDFSVHVFTQADLAGNRQLVQHVVELATRGQARRRAVDLFCGIGNFTFPLARHFEHVIGIEGSREAIRQARTNMEELGRLMRPPEQHPTGQGSVQFQLLDLFAADTATTLIPLLKTCEVLVLDPPREGALEICRQLAGTSLAPVCRRIVYVSCNPATFARDILPLLEGGFTLETVRPLDMFALTHHVELVAALVRQE